MIGLGTKCLRCLGPKPAGGVGKGVSLSRRGLAAICSECGVEEAIVDFQKGDIPLDALCRETRLKEALKIG